MIKTVNILVNGCNDNIVSLFFGDRFIRSYGRKMEFLCIAEETVKIKGCQSFIFGLVGLFIVTL